MKTVIVSAKMSLKNKEELSKYAHIVEFSTVGITYAAIDCHVDIFICLIQNRAVVAPNCPLEYIAILAQHGYEVIVGNQKVGEIYPQSCKYNVSFSSSLVLGSPKFYDEKLLEILQNRKWIPLRQGYGRCNTLFLNESLFLTSDIPTFNKLSAYGCEGVLLPSSMIRLQGCFQGFIGGCCGIWENTFYLNGSLNSLPQNLVLQINQLMKKASLTVVELGKDALEDVGGLFFISPKV